MKQSALVLAMLAMLALVTVLAPAIAYAQELIPTPEMAAPLGLLTFGIVGLVGGAIGYFRRHRAAK